MIHLYCVVDDRAAAFESCRNAGPDGLVVTDVGPFACVGRSGETPPASAEPQALLDHDAVVRRLMGVCTAVPFRYGTVLASEEEVQAQLTMRAAEFELLLARFHGKVELALRAASAPAPRPCAASGRAYLRTLRHQAGRAVLQDLHRTLAASSDAAVLAADRPCSMKSAYLVEKQGVDWFCSVLARTLSGLEGIRDASLTGPWAPYSFVSEATAAAGRPQPVVPGGADA